MRYEVLWKASSLDTLGQSRPCPTMCEAINLDKLYSIAYPNYYT